MLPPLSAGKPAKKSQSVLSPLKDLHQRVEQKVSSGFYSIYINVDYHYHHHKPLFYCLSDGFFPAD